MISTRYALCASRVIRDAEENRVSVIDLLDDLIVPAFPVAFPRLSMIWCISREAEDPEVFHGNIVLRLNEVVLMETPLEVNFQGALVTRANTVIGGLALPTPGRFSVKWSIPNQLDAEYQINIQSQPHLANTQGQPPMMGFIA